MYRIWLAAGLVNVVAGGALLFAVVPHFSPDSPLHWWYLAVPVVGALNVVGALRKSRLWFLLLPLNALSVPGWAALGLFSFKSAWVGLAAAAIPTVPSLSAFVGLLVRSLSRRQ